jgi:hypothetical protein
MKRNGWGVKSLPKGFRQWVLASKSASAFANERWATDMTHFFCKEAGLCYVIVLIFSFKRYTKLVKQVRPKARIHHFLLSITERSH